jgi:hypothetical protein
MAQFDGGPWLDLGGFARMSIFICHATGGRCEDWDPYKGANRVLLQRVRDDSLYDGPPTVRVYRRVRLTVDPPVDERKLAGGAGTYDKLGGVPGWLQGDDAPRSMDGSGNMRFVAQLTTDVVTFDITRGGRAYIYVDPGDTSEKAGYLLWQGA